MAALRIANPFARSLLTNPLTTRAGPNTSNSRKTYSSIEWAAWTRMRLRNAARLRESMLPARPSNRNDIAGISFSCKGTLHAKPKVSVPSESTLSDSETPFMKIPQFETRRAYPSDADDIAVAHRDSIRSIGPRFYPENVVHDWEEGLVGDVYVKAMEGGEVFFIATGEIQGEVAVLGFASDYRVESSQHGASVYVRGSAARLGIGSALLRVAEAHAVADGATSIQVEASLAAVEFYQANEFVEIGRGETRLMSGRPIACVFMRKTPLAAESNQPPPGRGESS